MKTFNIILPYCVLLLCLIHFLFFLHLQLKSTPKLFSTCKHLLTINILLKSFLFLILFIYLSPSLYNLLLSSLNNFIQNSFSLNGLVIGAMFYISEIIIILLFMFEICYSYEYSRLFNHNNKNSNSIVSTIIYIIAAVLVSYIVLNNESGFEALLVSMFILFIAMSFYSCASMYSNNFMFYYKENVSYCLMYIIIAICMLGNTTVTGFDLFEIYCPIISMIFVVFTSGIQMNQIECVSRQTCKFALFIRGDKNEKLSDMIHKEDNKKAN